MTAEERTCSGTNTVEFIIILPYALMKNNFKIHFSILKSYLKNRLAKIVWKCSSQRD